MFTLKPTIKDFSRSVGLILNKKGAVVETIYFTEKLRGQIVDYAEETRKFNEGMKKYCIARDDTVKDEYILTENYTYEMCCHAKATPSFDRFIKIFYGTSGSGKSYNLAKLIRRYKQAHPTNSVIYGSVNSVENEPAFDRLVTPVLGENGKPIKLKGRVIVESIIKELNLNKIETVLDVFSSYYKDSLMLFDDLDANTGTFTYTDMDPTLTPDKFKKLPIKEQGKIIREVENKMDTVARFLRASAKSIIFNGRKQRISFVYIFHSFFNNKFENELIGEASSVVVFPSKIDMSTFSRWLQSKMLFTKDQADWFTNRMWYKWDYCEIDKTSSRKFVITNDTLKIF